MMIENFIENLRHLDSRWFFALNDFAKHSERWGQIIQWFADYGILLIVTGLIYLVVRIRINALFTAILSCIFSTFVSFLLFLLWQRPRPFVTYADAVNKIAGYTTVSSFPSAHTYLSFAIATAVLVSGHKKLGVSMFLVAAVIGISRVAAGVHYPSDIIGGAIIGIFSGLLAYWFMEHFENFWQRNSAQE